MEVRPLLDPTLGPLDQDMEALLREASACSSPDSSAADTRQAPTTVHRHRHVRTPIPKRSVHRHTWLMVPEDFEHAPPAELKSAGPLLRGGFTAPLHMARRAARHGEATKAWRRAAFTAEGGRTSRVQDI